MKTKVLSISILVLVIAVFLWRNTPKEEFLYEGEKQRGMAVVAPPKIVESLAFREIAQLNSNWVSLMPYGYVKDKEPIFYYQKEGENLGNSHQWWGESPQGIRSCIKMAHQEGLKVMLKPHMWIGWGVFTGDFTLESEEDWEVFEDTYGAYLLQNARIAQDLKVSLFCIGTEMAGMVRERPEFWKNLIVEIRKIYKGELTYAENWDKIVEVPFWAEMDYIGVDAYFPLVKGKNPKLTAIKKGWKPWKAQLSELAKNESKPILFTEIGYRSCDTATEKPWETNYKLPDNEELQVKAYQALFQEIWQEPWFAGAHLWKWFPLGGRERESRDKFRFQNKSAQKLIKEQYGLLK